MNKSATLASLLPLIVNPHELLSKKTDSLLLVPGPEGWELWQGAREQGFQRSLEAGPGLVSEIEKIPAGPLVMGFPVREALAIPFKVPTVDESMFEDLAAMQLEKIGIRPDPHAGVLDDYFHAGQHEEESSLLSVVLSPPAEGSMPRRTPSSFDISARMFRMEDNAVTFWCELGRWVFAVTSMGHLTYFQSLAGTGVTQDAVREVRLALSQLKLQGVDLQVDKAVVWQSKGDRQLDAEGESYLTETLDLPLYFVDKPPPVLPARISRLVPADVRAEQRMRQERIKRNLGIAAILVIYLGLVAYLAYDYIEVDGALKEQAAELDVIRADHGDIGEFNDEWDQLAPVVESQNWPLTVLKRSAGLISANQDLRFKVFDAKVGQVTIRGEAGDIKLTSAYAGRLRRSLSGFDWSLPPAEPDAKTNRWKFNYEGILEGSVEEL